MQIVKSNKFTTEESLLVDKIINSISKSNGQDIVSFEPKRSVFISKDASECPDFLLNINEFINPQPLARERMLILFNLSALLFGSQVEPRILIADYNDEAAQSAPQKIEETVTAEQPSKDIVKEVSSEKIKF